MVGYQVHCFGSSSTSTTTQSVPPIRVLGPAASQLPTTNHRSSRRGNSQPIATHQSRPTTNNHSQSSTTASTTYHSSCSGTHHPFIRVVRPAASQSPSESSGQQPANHHHQSQPTTNHNQSPITATTQRLLTARAPAHAIHPSRQASSQPIPVRVIGQTASLSPTTSHSQQPITANRQPQSIATHGQSPITAQPPITTLQHAPSIRGSHFVFNPPAYG